MKWNTHFFETNKHGFQENKHYCLKEKTSFLYIFCLLPWKFVESLLQTFSQTFRGVASLTETFNANLQGWIESFNANFQGWIESLKKLVVYCANCFDMLHPPCLNVF